MCEGEFSSTDFLEVLLERPRDRIFSFSRSIFTLHRELFVDRFEVMFFRMSCVFKYDSVISGSSVLEGFLFTGCSSAKACFKERLGVARWLFQT